MPLSSVTFPLVWPEKGQKELAHEHRYAWEAGQAYAQHAQSVRRYARALVGNTPEADDIMQECFVRLMQTLQGGVQVERALPWLLRVAHNLALDALSRRPRELPLEESHIELLTDPVPDPETVAAEREQRERIAQALASLSAQELRCWTLRSEGLKYREIAGILGVQTGTVATFLVRAAEKLSSL